MVLLFFPPSNEHMKGFVSKCTALERHVTGPSNIPFDGVYMCTFQPQNCAGWGSEGVKLIFLTYLLFFFSFLFCFLVGWGGGGVGGWGGGIFQALDKKTTAQPKKKQKNISLSSYFSSF